MTAAPGEIADVAMLQPARASGHQDLPGDGGLGPRMAQRIEVPYVLVLFAVPVHEVDGVRYVDDLWAQDLREHCRYIPDLTLVSYVVPGMPTGKPVRLDACPILSRMRFVCVAKPRSMLHGVRMLPGILRALWGATRGAGVVQGEVAGWPFPSAWLLLPMRLLRPFAMVIVVESAFWRVLARDTLARRAWRAFVERANAVCVRRADLCLYTHDGYRQSLGDGRESLVTPASWIRVQDILADAEADRLVRERVAPHPLRLVFAGRLTEEKGVASLVRVLKQHALSGPVHLDIYGSGPLEANLRAAEVDAPGLRIRFMGTVAYEALFATLRRYDALVLPTITDEQPRILFDAYSQGLPVIASTTQGTCDYHQEGEHGTSFTPGAEQEMARAIERFASLRYRWPEMTRTCLASARSLTHEKMHSTRAEAINRVLERLRPRPSAAP